MKNSRFKYIDFFYFKKNKEDKPIRLNNDFSFIDK